MSTSTKVAIAVPVAVGGALLIAAIIFLIIFLRRRKQRQQQQQQKEDGQALQEQADKPPPYEPELSREEMATATAPVAGWTAPTAAPRFPFNEPTQSTLDAGPDAHQAIGVALVPEQQHHHHQQTQPAGATGAAATGFHDINDNHSRTQSPFDDPDDAMSEISRFSGRRRDGESGGTGSVRSAVSAVSDDEGEHGHGHGQRHGLGLGHA